MKIFLNCNLKMLIKNPLFFLRKVLFVIKCSLGYNKIFTIQGSEIILPNIPSLGAIYDIFIIGIYRKINNLNCVLDLGGYIGESAIYLSNFNKKVIVYEMAKDNFSYLEKNIHHKKNIIGYHQAVIGKQNINSVKFTSNTAFSVGGKIIENNKQDNHSYSVEATYIGDILKKNTEIDGIKMDIEGGEYPIIKYFIINNIFPFKKGIIEFHFNETVDIKIFILFIEYLGKSGYIYEIFDDTNTLQSLNDLIHDKKISKTNMNIFFEKINIV